MVSWRESRLLLMSIVLMMAFVAIVASIQLNNAGFAVAALPKLPKIFVSPTPAPALPKIVSQVDEKKIAPAFPVEKIPKQPANPFED